VHPDGTAGALRAAAAAGTIGAVSTLSGDLLEDVVPAGNAPGHWFQLYKLGGTDGAKVLVDRAAAAGYRALVVTVDSPIVGYKERDVRNGGVRPGGVSISKVDLETVLAMAPKVIGKPRWLLRFLRSGLPLGHPNLDRLTATGDPVPIETAMARWRTEPLVWNDFAWLRERWPGPIVVKGVLSAADARRCVDVGADAILVSNHGGRQLDGVPATIDALPDVVDAADGQAEVLLDSGVRRGTDVVAALALGAKAVLIGRPYLYGLAEWGEAGVSLVLELLRAEIERALVLLGCPAVTDLDRSWLAGSGEPLRSGLR
jgi:isopentenyl diphosphate isomerase/L-lactate dehydrogenase-like FMN-dependent dehydrogenase